jgi:rubrerythrin
MEQSQFEQIIGFAIDKERESIIFYETLARKIEEASSKEAVLSMANEERKHEKILKSLTPKNMRFAEPSDLTDIRLSDFLADVEPSKDLSYQELLTIAIKREEKAHAFYANLESRAADDATRKIFALLRGEELKHKNKLEKEYEEHVLREG